MNTISSLYVYSLLLVSLLCLLTMALVIWRQREEKRIWSNRAHAIQQKIESVLNDTSFETEREMFGKALQTATLTTELQRPRLETLAKFDKQAPEKYRIFGKLASQGLKVDEIAAIMGVSNVEANQLLKLCSVAQMRQGV